MVNWWEDWVDIAFNLFADDCITKESDFDISLLNVVASAFIL
jgi:hypothetical protein